MYSQTQGQGGCGAGSTYAGTDWQALEVQLNRTRTILQEILVHLQEVLHNLKMARTGGRGFTAASGSASASNRCGGHETHFRAQAGSGAQSARTTTASAGARSGNTSGSRTYATGAASGSATAGQTHTGGTTGASERHRTWTRQGYDGRGEAGSGRFSRAAAGAEAGTKNSRFRTAGTTGEQSRTGEGRTFRTGTSFSRGQGPAGQTFRERPRTENTSRAGATGRERETRQGTTSAGGGFGTAGRAQQTRTATSSRAGTGPRFRMDEARQGKAREAARKSGMNLKCAYDILCLDYPCSVDEIKGAYRHMARLYHPDLGGDEEAMKDVNVAYELAMRFSAGPRRASTAWAV